MRSGFVFLPHEVPQNDVVSLDKFCGPFDLIIQEARRDNGVLHHTQGVALASEKGLFYLDGGLEKTTVVDTEEVYLIVMKHAYSKVRVIKPGTHTRALLRSTPKPRGVKLNSLVYLSIVQAHDKSLAMSDTCDLKYIFMKKRTSIET